MQDLEPPPERLRVLLEAAHEEPPRGALERVASRVAVQVDAARRKRRAVRIGFVCLAVAFGVGFGVVRARPIDGATSAEPDGSTRARRANVRVFPIASMPAAMGAVSQAPSSGARAKGAFASASAFASTSASARSRSAVPSESAPGPGAPTQTLTPTPKPTRTRTPAAAAGEASATPSEIEILEGAQDALRSDPARALALAALHERLYPSGALVQEREVIAVDALVRSGRTAAARARADRFRAAWSGSAHLGRVEALFSAPQER